MAELIIDSNYYNKLDIEGFSKMMSSPSYCYKFYWLEAIVQLISANRTEATYDEDGNPIWTCQCKVKEVDIVTNGRSSSKKDAKKQAAFDMLTYVLEEE